MTWIYPNVIVVCVLHVRESFVNALALFFMGQTRLLFDRQVDLLVLEEHKLKQIYIDMAFFFKILYTPFLSLC